MLARDASALAAVIDFRPSVPELGTFPRAAWLRATAHGDAHAAGPLPRLQQPDAACAQLRSAVAEYLGRVRGVVADAEQVVICNGFSHGLSLVARQLLDTGHTTFAVEDPGHDGPRAELDWLGASHHPVPVDGDGIVVEELATLAGACRAGHPGPPVSHRRRALAAAPSGAHRLGP